MRPINENYRILPPEVYGQLKAKLQENNGGSESAQASARISQTIQSASMLEMPTVTTKNSNIEKKSSLHSVKHFFASIKKIFAHKLHAAEHFGSLGTNTIISMFKKQDGFSSAIEQNKSIIDIFQQKEDLAKTKGVMRLSVPQSQLKIFLTGKKSLQEATAVQLTAIFKVNLQKHLSLSDQQTIKKIFETYHNDQLGNKEATPSLQAFPEMAKDAILFARIIAKHNEENMMNESNLAKIVAPNFMAQEDFNNIVKFTRFIEAVIKGR